MARVDIDPSKKWTTDIEVFASDNVRPKWWQRLLRRYPEPEPPYTMCARVSEDGVTRTEVRTSKDGWTWSAAEIEG